MTALLEVTIGLIALYLILSLVASAANEALAGIFKRRSAFLEKGIQNLLGDVMAGRFFNHGLIRGLSRNRSSGAPGRPSYVSGPIFARTVLDLVGNLPSAPPAAGAGAAGAPPAPAFPAGFAAPRDAQVVALQAKVEGLPNVPPNVIDSNGGEAILNLGQALAVLARESRDIGDLETKVENWFDESMDRVSGWYKRRTAVILFGIGVVLVAALNADTLNIAKTLWTHPDIRAAVVAQAEKTVQTAPQVGATPAPIDAAAAVAAIRGVAALKVPVGWKSPAVPDDPRSVPTDASGWLFKIAGLLLTSAALTFGAPFWFDLLKSFVGIRTSGPSPAEASASSGGSGA